MASCYQNVCVLWYPVPLVKAALTTWQIKGPVSELWLPRSPWGAERSSGCLTNEMNIGTETLSSSHEKKEYWNGNPVKLTLKRSIGRETLSSSH